MAKPRSYSRYELRERGKVVYRGITRRDPEQRAQEHTDEGKHFTSLNVVGPKVTRDTAHNWEEQSLAQYRQSHGGHNPRYNESPDG